MSDQRVVNAPPEGIEGWSEVWREDLRFPPQESAGFLKSFLFPVFRKFFDSAAREHHDRQRNFNVAVLELLEGLRTDVVSLRSELADLSQEVARVRDLIPVAVRRNDALFSAIDQKIETTSARLRDLTNQTAAVSSVPPERKADIVYRRLEDALRGSQARITGSLEDYLPYVRLQAPVIDLGCGRGEFLSLCKAEGVEAQGFDSNERSVADLQKRGLKVDLGRVPDCLDELEPGTVGTLFASHLVEHILFPDLFALFASGFKVLRSGGFLIIETPNAESMRMSSTDFWRDPTHLAPRHAASLTVLGREHGFEVEDFRTMHPFSLSNQFTTEASDPPSLQTLSHGLNQLLFGDQDLRLILRKP